MFRTGRTYTTHRYRKAGQEERPIHPVGRFVTTVFKLAAIVSVPLVLAYLEQSQAETQAAVAEALVKVVPATPTTKVGSLVFASSHSVQPDLISDQSFGLDFPNAVRVKRSTEYCQWQEFTQQDSRTERDEDGNEHTVTTTTYYYNKGWYSYPINSFFFDQPAAHYNPQRDPYPSKTQTTSKLTLGEYTVRPSVLQNANEGWSTRKRYSASQLDIMTETSSAAIEHGFKYVGDGYFYSPYEATNTATFLRAVGMALEGSLLDYQIADVVNGLFGQCAAGDIRVKYQAIVASPEQGAAVVGKLEENNAIGVYVMKNGYKMGLYENTAETDAGTMFKKLLSSAWWWVVGGYVATLIWAAVVTYWYPWNPLEGVKQRQGGEPTKNPLDVYIWAAEAVALALVTVGAAKILVTDEFVVGMVVAGAGVGVLSLSSAPWIRARFGEEKEKTD
ncbi:hypothetical protein BCR33DRAFT_764237 [Rhizoclosmatium globosum]|uniref:Uncharacterized protein n=1 Tax=Rhizoclosmatium globosum TaxID=329046 RepID=A0A1Y2CNH3_9FUNG|nr:hypothetical protein BCR33DRAFT_764237 [Rhizoclosmatium globosum]|eukprot:ORY47885.1 hypothetical protein BCR33DRAFT_764237 [Rhizoclosmatium globosum]